MEKFNIDGSYYYKGKEYVLVKFIGEQLAEIKNNVETKTIELRFLLTPEEFEHQKNNRISTHQNWIGP